MNKRTLLCAVAAQICSLSFANLFPELEEKDYTPSLVAEAKRKAEEGDIEQQAIYGRALSNGWGVKENAAEAIVWLKKAAESGNPTAQCSLGGCYADGHGVGKSQETAVIWFEKAASQGLTRAQVFLGQSYFDGEGIGEDKGKAVEWWSKAAEQGNADAQYLLGFCLENGAGIVENKAKAAEWYAKSAEQGNAVGQRLLGLCLYNGIGVDVDKAKSVAWWTKAAEQGDAEAQLYLEFCFRNGEGVAKDTEKALHWLTEAARLGNAEAQTRLGECFSGGKGVVKDMTRAVELFIKAAEQGYDVGQLQLARCYLNGTGVDKNAQKAVEWLTKAAEQDNAEAQAVLAFCYFTGNGVPKDLSRYEALLEKSANQGYVQAQFGLGMYYHGRYLEGRLRNENLEQDEQKAQDWLARAAEQGHKDARDQLVSLKQSMEMKKGISANVVSRRVTPAIKVAAYDTSTKLGAYQYLYDNFYPNQAAFFIANRSGGISYNEQKRKVSVTIKVDVVKTVWDAWRAEAEPIFKRAKDYNPNGVKSTKKFVLFGKTYDVTDDFTADLDKWIETNGGIQDWGILARLVDGEGKQIGQNHLESDMTAYTGKLLSEGEYSTHYTAEFFNISEEDYKRVANLRIWTLGPTTTRSNLVGHRNELTFKMATNVTFCAEPIRSGIWMGMTEVTQGEWAEVMGDTTPSDPNMPKTGITETMATNFVAQLNSRFSHTAYRFRLPTVEEWKSAAKANTVFGDYRLNVLKTGLFSDSRENKWQDLPKKIPEINWWGIPSTWPKTSGSTASRIQELGWFIENSEGKPHPVAQKEANAFGLFDMLGNADERCYEKGLRSTMANWTFMGGSYATPYSPKPKKQDNGSESGGFFGALAKAAVGAAVNAVDKEMSNRESATSGLRLVVYEACKAEREKANLGNLTERLAGRLVDGIAGAAEAEDDNAAAESAGKAAIEAAGDVGEAVGGALEAVGDALMNMFN